MKKSKGLAFKRLLKNKVIKGPNEVASNALIIFFCLNLLSVSGFSQEIKGFDLSRVSIPLDEIKDGGPPKDGIPSIDNPQFIPASEAAMGEDDRVLGVLFNGVAKAYPISILNYHEIVNDRFADAPVVITYCPLCASGLALYAVVDDKSLTFGVSGLLYNSDLLLYDRQTSSLWSQMMSEAVSGNLLGKKLKPLVTENTTWEEWKSRHPTTVVLSENTGFVRNYSKNPYPGYAQSGQLLFNVSKMDGRYHPKELVFGIEINGMAKAYPISELSKTDSKRIYDRFEGEKLLIMFNKKSQHAQVVNEDTGEAIPTIRNFWFAWYAFHPNTSVYVFKNK